MAPGQLSYQMRFGEQMRFHQLRAGGKVTLSV
ncbi:MAG: hypothetical protein ACI9U2_004890, partial [Bradymonadia bacterium]